MSTGRRAYDLLRAYVHREWDRIEGLARADALSELDAPMGQTAPPPVEAEEVVTVATRRPVEDPIAAARSILGVPPDADFQQVRHAFEKLNRRSDPANFPEGSTERAEAQRIRVQVYWAYRQLTADVSESEKRFRSLEIE